MRKLVVVLFALVFSLWVFALVQGSKDYHLSTSATRSFEHDEKATNAVLALKKVQAMVESGVSYRDYSHALAEASFPVKLFLESDVAKKAPEFSDFLKYSLKDYHAAQELWSEEIQKGFSSCLEVDVPCKEWQAIQHRWIQERWENAALGLSLAEESLRDALKDTVTATSDSDDATVNKRADEKHKSMSPDKWNELVTAAIKQHCAIEGMTMEEVEKALGKPASIFDFGGGKLLDYDASYHDVLIFTPNGYNIYSMDGCR